MGGLSETFGSQFVAQKAELPNVKGAVRSTGSLINGSGAFTTYGGNGAYWSYTSTSDWARIDLSTGQTNADGTTYVSQADSVYKDGGEVRPANFTVRIWRRTA